MRVYVEVLTGRHDRSEVVMRMQALDVSTAKDMVADLEEIFDCNPNGVGSNDLGEPVIVRHVLYNDQSQVAEGVFVL